MAIELNKMLAYELINIFCSVRNLLHIRCSTKTTQQMENNENLLTAELQVDSIAYAHLHETARWAKFLSVIGFIISVFLLLAAIFAGAFLSSFSGTGGVGGINSMIGTGVLSAVYIVIAVVYFIMSLFLFRFATKMRMALQASDQDNFNVSLYNLKMVYRITGIIVIVYLALVTLALIFGIGAAAFMS